jgi:hypothetical protein
MALGGAVGTKAADATEALEELASTRMSAWLEELCGGTV